MTRIGDRNRVFLCKLVHLFATLSDWDEVIGRYNRLYGGYEKQVFVVLDEFEKCFTEVNPAGLFADLSAVSGLAGARPLIIARLDPSSCRILDTRQYGIYSHG